MEVFASIFVGTPQVCSKIQEIQTLMLRVNATYPEQEIEAFIVPMPQEPEVAYVLQRHIIDNVNRLFSTKFPKVQDMN